MQSGANEPFRAEIRFVLEAHERDREFQVLLGTSQDYQLEELERPSVLEHMHIVLAPDKQDTVRIFSNVPMTDDTFDLLVLLRSGKLTIVRNYRVELQESVPAVQQQAVVEPAVPTTDAGTVAPPPQAGPAAAPSAGPEPELATGSPAIQALADSTTPYGPIQRGETMYNVVGKLGVSSDQRWQAVVLLWRANHGAFLRGNLHGLLVGVHLEVPTRFDDRLAAIDKESSQRIIANQWESWRRRQVTTAAEALAMTKDLRADKAEPSWGDADERAAERPLLRDTATVTDGMDLARQEPGAEEGAVAVAAPEMSEMGGSADARFGHMESIAGGSTAGAEVVPAVAEPGAREMASPSEESAPDDSIAAVAPPQVMRLPTDEGSTFVSTQELKLLLGNLESRLLRRLAPVQEIQDGASFVSPTELHVSLQDLENRLTKRVEQIVARGGIQVSPEPPAQPRPHIPAACRPAVRCGNPHAACCLSSGPCQRNFAGVQSDPGLALVATEIERRVIKEQARREVGGRGYAVTAEPAERWSNSPGSSRTCCVPEARFFRLYACWASSSDPIMSA